ncbi:hypothetical protein DNL40_10530 [Xylanimonas oleitrophica]|uniref:Integral membrane protein n=1 Tax=Xylanimonas oleitrophica TaxID=2607479 RepID=A0A2W5WP85_9MICO|nr:hypothetical protein [Xylanimonas oleitrophica]PZR52792.1 hypothetical protein DNL40_10530 [Xylanimonas oleitrophica]
MFELSDPARLTAGAVILSAITVASGGWFLTRVVRGLAPATEFQKSFFRAGHAHAGVLIILGLICLLLTEATTLTGLWSWLSRVGVLASAILMPAGFFLSALGAGRTRPNRLIGLLWVGAGFLVAGLTTTGVGLLTA